TFEDVRDGCIVTRIFTVTVTATDKCGNTATRSCTVRVTWNEDREPPVVNNVPETDKLPCNTRPTCELLIARHRIHAKDNCPHDPPTLNCEAGPVEDLGNCRFRQVFTFWAVDKCGNRSADYRVAVFWKEDTEPPVLHNVPPDRDLGCNPPRIPECDEILAGVTATDNCDPDVRVTCTYRDFAFGCLRIRSFILAAADECGNVTTRKVAISWTVDNTPPVVRCPDNIVVQARFPECLVPVTWRAKAEDDCDPNPRLECVPPSGSLFPIGKTTVVTCTATDRCGNSASCEFTVTVLGYICGIKFEDRNGNGAQDPGEPGLPGWTFELVRPADGAVIATAVSGPDGRFCFTGLLAGDYIVREVLQPGWENTTPREVRRNVQRDCGKLIFFGNRRRP
ncbi:MAG: HYR domain-containing protein, partial [Armatimonadota bacterium]